jgi:two-component system chemotaxis sensor kinase CheA
MEMFLEESREHLQSLNDCLLELEHNPEDAAVLNEIFRSAHTIKGMSATMGFTEIAELTHEMENVLDLLRKEQLKADEDIVDTIFKCVDTLEQMIENVAGGENGKVDVSTLVNKLNAIANGDAAPKPATVSPADSAALVASVLAQTTNNKNAISLNTTDLAVIKSAHISGLQAVHITVTLAESCLLKSARAYMVMNALDEVGEVVKSVPPADDLEQEKFEHSFDIVFLTGMETRKIEDILLSISEIETVTTEIIEADSSAEVDSADKNLAAVPVPAKTVVKTVEKASEKKVTANSSNNGAHDKKLKSGQSVRVDIDKLDSLMNLVGELVINKTRLEQIGNTHRITELVETIEQMDRVTTDLQSVVMKVRMVPVGQVFNRFPRMVRDLAKELNKEINLTIEGEETELDRTVIDEIGDPLVHLIRNSLDHGIEHPEDRQAKGKSKVGEVGLVARHEGNNVIIMVTDDGKGINPTVIKNKAAEKGLITQEDADAMDDGEAVRLVFLAGFSTADVVTDVSGRGVGMDVVRSKIEALGGLIDVETKIDEGSIFKIKLPLTLAIIQALLVKVQEEIYAIPLGSIDSTINITPDDIKTVQNKEVILLRGQIIPIVRLDNVLNVPQTQEKSGEDLFVVVVHMGERKSGIIVDNLIGQQEIVIKTLGKLLAGLKVISGATVLGNGQVALILDVGTLMQ